MTLPLWVMSSAGPCGIKEEEVLVETEHSPSRAARRGRVRVCKAAKLEAEWPLQVGLRAPMGALPGPVSRFFPGGEGDLGKRRVEC